MAIVIVVLGVVLALAFLPQMWVRKVIASHAHERADIPGSGGDLARHLLDGMGLGQVKVEETTLGDHYDPESKAVRLTKPNFSGRSLSAVVIAAHEVGHAMQDATGYAPLSARTRLAKQASRVEAVGAVVMLAAPLMMLFSKSPALFMIQILAGMLVLSFSILVHAVTLPVEYDASFRRALPLLAQGGYVQQKDMPSARHILTAAALTYVAAAAISLLDVMRWIRMIRF